MREHFLNKAQISSPVLLITKVGATVSFLTFLYTVIRLANLNQKLLIIPIKIVSAYFLIFDLGGPTLPFPFCSYPSIV